MCGIVAVLAKRSERLAPTFDQLLGALREGLSVATGGSTPGRNCVCACEVEVETLLAASNLLSVADAELRGSAGLQTMFGAFSDLGEIEIIAHQVLDVVDELDALVDKGCAHRRGSSLEELSRALLALRDVCWSLSKDRITFASRAHELFPQASVNEDALRGLWSIEVALSCIDRLEVRGRDSAGIHIFVSGNDVKDAVSLFITGEANSRLVDPIFGSGSIRLFDHGAGFVYKVANEIGELGDNVSALRDEIAHDDILKAALSVEGNDTTVIGHTRWASVGIVSEANTHPLNSEHGDLSDPSPYVVAALNGDIDNYLELVEFGELSIPFEISTDAKVIPALLAQEIASSPDSLDDSTITEGFRRVVNTFAGSAGIVASFDASRDRIHLALKGSGQGLFIGLADDAYVVASEPYGLVEEASALIRMDGETSQGQVVVLDRAHAGDIAGISRMRYNGQALPLQSGEIEATQVTTRDIDRRGYPHFLLKEISEAPTSFRKTLRGRIVPTDDGYLAAWLDEEALPKAIVEAVASEAIKRVIVIGQGTAAVAGQAVAAAIEAMVPGLLVASLPATELSGFGLSDDMNDTLVVAISQSGTTTDTNRTVDLVKSRGASIIAIVNRRGSDITTRADGTIYTSDGRDVEMSVASTKAFYSQVAAGWVLACALADPSSSGTVAAVDRILRSLRSMPDHLGAILLHRQEIANAASSLAPAKRYWAVVGNGPNRIAANELRIKLSELCYKSIACDATEDKKHIDLSSEPLILVCATGLTDTNADDVAKEVSIYKAHKASPIVIASQGSGKRFGSALHVIEVPKVEPEHAFILSAMVGHLFGYEAALAIDSQATPLRLAKAEVENLLASSVDLSALDLDHLAQSLATATAPFFAGLRSGQYNGSLEASSAVALVSVLRYATGELPVDSYELETGKIATPTTLLNDLLASLTSAIDELTRPIDAIKHQAKTVTVGISRNEDEIMRNLLVSEVLRCGPSPDELGYRALRSLVALSPAVVEVLGYTRYRIDLSGEASTISVIDRGGIATTINSRTAVDARLRGTKHRAVDEREVTVARGRSDGRTVILIPESKANVVRGMTLLHVQLAEYLQPAVMKAVLEGYRNRYSALSDAITETETSVDEEILGSISVVELLTAPVYVLAEHWQNG